MINRLYSNQSLNADEDKWKGIIIKMDFLPPCEYPTVDQPLWHWTFLELRDQNSACRIVSTEKNNDKMIKHEIMKKDVTTYWRKS